MENKIARLSRSFMRVGIVLISIFLIFCSKSEAIPIQDQVKVQAAVDQVRSTLESKLNKEVPSLSLLIQTKKGTIFVSSVPSGNMPLTKDTYFRFASNTKLFTSTAILKMNQDGWLNYKAKITDQIPGSSLSYVPDNAKWNIPYKNDITIEQLLQHSAGVYDVDNSVVPGCGDTSFTLYQLALNPNHQFSAEELVEQAATHNLSFFKPGTGYHYSNTGYTILAEIISRVYSVHAGQKKTSADFLYDHITGRKAKIPVNIHFPYLASDTNLPTPFATGREIGSKQSDTATFNMSAQVGEGNGYATFSELNKFVRSLMKGENVLSPQTLQLMQNSGSVARPNYALGCFFTKNLGYGHNGARIGYLSVMAYDPDYDVSVVVLLTLIDSSSEAAFINCFTTLTDAAYAARSALGYPGKP